MNGGLFLVFYAGVVATLLLFFAVWLFRASRVEGASTEVEGGSEAFNESGFMFATLRPRDLQSQTEIEK